MYFYINNLTKTKQVSRELIVSNYLVGSTDNNHAVKAKIEKYEKKLTLRMK